MVSVRVPKQKNGRAFRMFLCFGVFTVASACSVDVTDLTPFAEEESEARVARATKANPVNSAAVTTVAGDKTRDRIETQPAYTLASGKEFSQIGKLNDRIPMPASEPRRAAQVVPEAAAASPKRIAVSHVVVSKGDTLYSIARRHGVKLSKLMSLNNIDASARLSVGQRLEIPYTQSGMMPLATADTLIVADAPPSWRTEKVVVITPVAATRERRVTLTSGTTLYSIARANGVTVAELARANGIVDPTKVRAGTVLTIPGQVHTSVPTVNSASAPLSQSNIQNTDRLVTGAVPVSEQVPGALARDRAKRKAAAIASYQRTANQYRLTPGQTALVPF